MKNLDKTISKEKSVVAKMTNKSEKVVLIKTDADVILATEFLVQVKDKIKTYEEERQGYTMPLNESLRKLNARFKELTEPLKNAERVVKDAIVLYRQKKEELRLEAESKLQKKNGNENIIIQDTLPDIVESKSGETRVTRRWTFEVIEEKKIPREYLTVDVTKVNEAIRNEVRTIPGLKIYQKEDISVY